MRRKSNVIGLRPVPPNEVLESFIERMVEDDTEILEGQIEQLGDTVKESLQNRQPKVFAYAKMLNFLAGDEMSKEQVVHLCAAAMWKIWEDG